MDDFLEATLVMSIIFAIGVVLYRSYAGITKTVNPDCFHYKVRKYLKRTLYVCFLLVNIAAFTPVPNVVGDVVFIIMFSTLALALLLLLSTPLSIACREQWGRFFRHPATKFVGAGFVALVVFSFAILRFFLGAAGNDASNNKNESGYGHYVNGQTESVKKWE